MSTSSNSTLFRPDSSSSSETVETTSSSAFEAAQRVHYSTSPTSPFSSSFYRPQHSRQNSRDPAFHSDSNGSGNGSSFLPSLVSDPLSYQQQPQSRSSSFSSTTSATSSSSTYSERHDHHQHQPHFYHEQQKTSEPAAYGYQRNHSQHIYQAHANNSNINNNDASSPPSHLLPQSPAEPFALYSLNQHQHNNNGHQQPHRDNNTSLPLSSSPRRASKNGDGVFGTMSDHDHQGIPLPGSSSSSSSSSTASRPIHSRQASSISVTAAAASATIAHLHLHDHPPTTSSSSSSPPPPPHFNSFSSNTAATLSFFQSRHSPPSPHSPSLLFPSSSSSSHHHHHPLSSSSNNSSSSAFLGPALSSSSSSRSPQTPPLTPSPRKHDSSPPLQGNRPHHPHPRHQQQYHGQQHHPASHHQTTGAGVRGAVGPVSSAAHAEKAMHKVLAHEPGCVKSRRLAHILSEQKRREKINGGFDELKSVIPE